MYLFMPMLLLAKFYVNKNDKLRNIFYKYFSFTFVNNLLCWVAIKIYYKNSNELKLGLDFAIKYSILALVIGVIIIIMYHVVKNYFSVKLEVKNEGNKKM